MKLNYRKVKVCNKNITIPEPFYIRGVVSKIKVKLPSKSKLQASDIDENQFLSALESELENDYTLAHGHLSTSVIGIIRRGYIILTLQDRFSV